MQRLNSVLCTLYSVLFLVLLSQPALSAGKQLRAGAFAIDITPLELPVIVNGGMTERVVDKAEDRLHARCLVLDDGTTSLAIVIVDSCMMPRDLLDDAKRQAEAATKIPASNILIAATHTHSAPSVFGCLGSDADEKYSKFLPVQIAKGIQQAHANLQPARIGWAVGRDAKNVASRRWLMQPGVAPTNAYGGKANDRVMMHPGPANKNAVAATGIIDPDVPVLSVQTKDGQPLAVLTNYSMHYVGAPNLSADYFAVVCEKMREHLKVADDTPFVALHSNGTSGDQWLMDYTQPRRQFDRFTVASDVAAAAFEAFQRINYYDWVPLVMAESELELGIRQPNAEELAEATKLYDTFKDRKPKTLPEVYAREAVLLANMPARRKIKLQALRIGELGIAAIPNEVFSSTGLQIKIESPTPTTFTIELANGAEGYIPPPKQHKLGGYETWRARSSCLEVTAEPKIRAAVLDLLNKVNDERADEALVLASGKRELPDVSEKTPTRQPSTAGNQPVITETAPRVPKRATPPLPQPEPRQATTEVLTADAPWRGALTPENALRAFQLAPGFKIELVASEPQIVDPVAFDWGFDGKLWVVEMHDYPNGLSAAGPNDKGPPGGRVKVLEDANGDGRYEKATTFADKLSFPNGIMVMPDGSVLVTSAPQILRLQDTDGDGQSDQQEVLFSGFTEGNQQLRVNGLKWGLDGWIYCANGGVGRGDPKARIKIEHTGELVDVGARDFRFSLDYKQLEPVLGMSQFGRNRDDFGNWFGCNNNTPLYHVVHDDAMLRRNPHLAPHATTVFVPRIAKPGPVYAISEKGRFWHESEVGRFTSANSAMIFRDTASVFNGEFFVSEPVHNLVHRENIKRQGVTFTSERAHGEEQREFLASTDTWFRPNMIRTGPDGALYISDMYREIIEHPGWIQPEKKAHLTFRNGDDRGRIWRVVKTPDPAFGGRAFPSFSWQERHISKKSTANIVKLLGSSNGEQRDMAQRWLLVKRPKDVTKALLAMWNEKLSSEALVQTLHTLAAFDALTDDHLAVSMAHQDACVRAVAVKLAAGRGNSAVVLAALQDRVKDSDPAVLMQTAYALGEVDAPYVAEALASIIASADDPFVREAALSSITPQNVEAVASVMTLQPGEPATAAIAAMALKMERPRVLKNVFGAIAPGDAMEPYDAKRLASLLDSLQAEGITVANLREVLADPQIAPRFQAAVRDAGKALDAADESAEPNSETGLLAIRLMGRAEPVGDDLKRLQKCLAPKYPPAWREAAVEQLARLARPETPALLLTHWPTQSPQVRGLILDKLLAREAWTGALLAKLKSGEVLAADLDASRRRRLLEHPNANLKLQAVALLAQGADSDRQTLVTEWSAKVLASPGDMARGKVEFAKRCATCHKWQGEGATVGPDLNTLTDRSPKTLLTAILNPNLAVEPKYQAYAITTVDGQVLSGMLVEESSSGLTLADAGGKLVQVPRSKIEELRSTGRSLMPEGLERDITPEALADILSLLSQPASSGK